MANLKEILKTNYFPFLILASSLTLVVTSFYNFLLFHTLVELFTVVIALGIFVIAWSSRRYIESDFLLILGISYLFTGGMDLIHTLSYKGMGIFAGYTANLPTQLWIAARYLEAASFAVAFLFLKEKPARDLGAGERKANIVILVYLLIFAAISYSIFYAHNFPDAYNEATGLTAFKKVSEYIISFLFLVSIFLLFRKRKILDREMVGLLSVVLIVKILAEISFTEYVGVYDFANMLGHIFKYISFLLLYKAILEIGLMNPYQFLFRNLKKSETEARNLARFPEENPNPIIRAQADGRVQYANQPARELLSSLNWKENMLLPELIFSAIRGVFKSREYKELELTSPSGRVFLFVLSPNGNDNTVNLYGTDITSRRQAEKKLLDAQVELIRKSEERLIESYEYLGMINRRISLLVDLSNCAGDRGNKKEIADFILHSAMNLSKAKTGLLYKYTGSNEFKLISRSGLEGEKAHKFQVVSIDNVIFAEKLSQEKTRVSGPCHLFNPCCFKEKLGFSYFIALPIVESENFRGFLFLGFTDRKSMDSQELEFFDVFAVHASAALKSAKVF